uniref:Uncharacterized protein n=1 Tax=Aegilops tauschii subsp. strangulata TaxID=200361 RepID=A0A453JMW9_AEGTS
MAIHQCMLVSGLSHQRITNRTSISIVHISRIAHSKNKSSSGSYYYETTSRGRYKFYDHLPKFPPTLDQEMFIGRK